LIKRFLSRHAFLRRAILILLVYGCFRAVPLEFKATREYQQIVQWPVADAVINSATVGATSYSWGWRKNRFCPKLDYNYTVKGHEYASYNSVFDFTCWPDAYNFVAQHRPGTSIQIAYDPTDPAVTIVPTSIRDPGYPWGDIVGGALFFIILVSDLFLSRPFDDRSAA
jgi:hypothetical protein